MSLSRLAATMIISERQSSLGWTSSGFRVEDGSGSGLRAGLKDRDRDLRIRVAFGIRGLAGASGP